LKLPNKEKQKIQEREELDRLVKSVELINPAYLIDNYKDLYNRLYSSKIITYIRYQE